METKIIKPSSEPRPGGFPDRSGQKEQPTPAPKPETKPKEKG